MNLDTVLTPFTKPNSQWVTNLNGKYKTIKLLGCDLGKDLDELQRGDKLFRYTEDLI